MSQELQILAYLKTGRGITPHQALEWFGCFRLAARIEVLRRKGWKIRTEMVDDFGRDGQKVRYARYWLINKRRNQWFQNPI